MFQNLYQELARTVTGNLLVSLMRDLTSVTAQGLYRMSGVSNDLQSRERVHVRMRSRRT